MKRSHFLKIVSIVLAVMLLLSFAACGNQTSNTSDQKATAAQTTAVEQKAVDPMAKYTTPIEVTTVRVLADSVKFKNGDTIDNNIWTQGYEKDLGIKVKNLWTVPQAQGEQKMNVAIASNDLPDIIPLVGLTSQFRMFKQLVNNGVALDMTNLIDTYTTPFAKDMLKSDDGIALQQVTIDGKVMGLPQVVGNSDAPLMYFIRADWVKNLGLDYPKTEDDLVKLAEAFVKNDPDKNGKADTFGIALSKDLYSTGYATIEGIMTAYHAYLGWIKDSSGKLVYGGIQPEMKTALGKAAELYKEGLFDKEFPVKDGTKVAESLASGKVGIVCGQHWLPFYPLPDSFKNNPDADWKPIALVSADSNPAKPMIGGSAGGVYVINKNAKNPEAAVKLFNYYYAKDTALSKDYDMNFHQDPNDLAYAKYQFALIQSFYGKQNISIYKGVNDYLKVKG